MEDKVKKLKELRDQKNDLDKQIKSLEDELKKYFKENGIDDLITETRDTVVYPSFPVRKITWNDDSILLQSPWRITC